MNRRNGEPAKRRRLNAQMFPLIAIALWPIAFGLLVTQASMPDSSGEASSSPSTFDASKVDTSTISEEEIQKTIAHRNALQDQLKSGLTNQAGSLSSAAADNQAADRNLKEYQSKVDALAVAAAKDHDAVLAQKAAILRRDIIIGVMSLAIGVYAFLKFYLRVPFL